MPMTFPVASTSGPLAEAIVDELLRDGVADVTVAGSEQPAIRVRADAVEDEDPFVTLGLRDGAPVEEARACALLIDDFDLSLGEVSERVGRSKPSVSNRMRLLDLSDDVLALVERGELSEGHARAVLAVPDQEGRRRLAREIVKTGMSVRAAEQKARWAGAKQKPRTKGTPVDPVLAGRVRAAAERLTGLPVRLTRGRLEVLFADEYELAELAEALERSAPRP